MDLNKLKRVPRWQKKRKWRGNFRHTNVNNNSPTNAEINTKRLANFKQELLFQALLPVTEETGNEAFTFA